MSGITLDHARRLFEADMKLCKLHKNSKRPIGNSWNKDHVTEFDDGASGYGLPLAINGRCSIDPDDISKAQFGLTMMGHDLDEWMATGVQTVSTRPDSGGRSMFKDPGDLRWIKIRGKDPDTGKTHTILELRASSPNLQDVIPGLQYHDAAGNTCTQSYRNGKTYADAPDLPQDLLNLWRQLSTDTEFRHQFETEFAEHVGLNPVLSLGGEGEPLAFKPTINRLRSWFNDEYAPANDLTIVDLLNEHGYTEADGRWAHPGATGLPGCRPIPGKGEELWRSDNGGDPLNGTFDNWAAYVVLEHEGDLEAAQEAVGDAFKAATTASADDFPDLDEELTDVPSGDAQKQLEEVKRKPEYKVPKRAELVPTVEMLRNAKLTPRCIVENYLYANLAQLIAEGGVGKTTLVLYEAICIALGLDLWGYKVVNPGWVLIVSAEDEAEQLYARLRQVAKEMGLSGDQQQIVRENVLIWDVTADVKRLAMVHDGNVVPTKLAAEMVDAYQDDRPAVVVFDPLVSFGGSESMVNDNEQALVNAARRLIKGLDCCVRFVHHTGKQNAREKALDQYAGRNGSALPDGSRMTSVMTSWRGGVTLTLGGEKVDRPPASLTEEPATEHTSYTVLNRAKLSYSPPGLPVIWIRRDGHTYTWAYQEEPDRVKEVQGVEESVLAFIRLGLHENPPTFHTLNSLTKNSSVRKQIGASKNLIEAAVNVLIGEGRLRHEPLPADERQGSKKTYLCPVD